VLEITNRAHPKGSPAASFPAELFGPAPLVLQGQSYFSFAYANASEFLSTRCARDFSEAYLEQALHFVEQRMGGRAFLSLHVRLEDFPQMMPGEDRSPPLEKLAAYAARVALNESLSDVFLATNGTPEEKEKLFSLLQARGLRVWSHPRSTSWQGIFLDMAIAGYAQAFVGNLASTYSYDIAFQLVCAGRQRGVRFYRAKDAPVESAL
jgi:hypothetical protein